MSSNCRMREKKLIADLNPNKPESKAPPEWATRW
jgi:hypothetical protein